MIARNSSSQAALRVLGVSELVGWKICVSCFCVSFLNEFTASPKTDGTPQKITRWSLPIDYRSLWPFKMGSLWDPWMDKWVILKNQFTSCATATNWSYVVAQTSCSFTPTRGNDPILTHFFSAGWFNLPRKVWMVWMHCCLHDAAISMALPPRSIEKSLLGLEKRWCCWLTPYPRCSRITSMMLTHQWCF